MAIRETKNQLQFLLAHFLPVSALKILAWEGAYIFHSEDSVQLLSSGVEEFRPVRGHRGEPYTQPGWRWSLDLKKKRGSKA